MLVHRMLTMPRVSIGPTRLLASMMRSGRYYPSAQWAMTAYGKGMHRTKLEAIWKAIISPE